MSQGTIHTFKNFTYLDVGKPWSMPKKNTDKKKLSCLFSPAGWTLEFVRDVTLLWYYLWQCLALSSV